ncbi:MAG: DUF4892 domain-containing protein [Pseudomonadales bacterium]|jgi:hypothetical protein|nr:DUF4892 domain-containing protein [Pseudomonadales bacterium]MDP6473156.1 DUF4892 domain-containing protein [Pseudomonadales bacterium]MDP6826087.1 DUF4892 domain-containing protein [Pseudomonadales bacterium]MDP6970380.1 DUF4892 domain-containing protein [Pseudomonadales bacterium]|tara:strand:+ start:3533 stop:4411 length:879 start_codon:yes stop_codon:yes gene_type:complete
MKGLWVAVLALLNVPAVAMEADDPEGVPRFPHAQVVSYQHDEQILPREFVTSPVEKIRRELKIREKLRISGSVLGITYEIARGTPLDEVIAHYDALFGEHSLFRCRGRDCGRSNGWANQVFGQAILFGPDRNQHYQAGKLNGDFVSVYVIERGNRRLYAHVRILTPQEQVEAITNSRLTADLAGNGFAVIQGVHPRIDGTLEEGSAAILDDLAPRLDIFERQQVYVVCHLYGLAHPETLIEDALKCATDVAVRMAREDGPNLVPYGAGPLLPRAATDDARIELVLPQHRNRR